MDTYDRLKLRFAWFHGTSYIAAKDSYRWLKASSNVLRILLCGLIALFFIGIAAEVFNLAYRYVAPFIFWVIRSLLSFIPAIGAMLDSMINTIVIDFDLSYLLSLPVFLFISIYSSIYCWKYTRFLKNFAFWCKGYHVEFLFWVCIFNITYILLFSGVTLNQQHENILSFCITLFIVISLLSHYWRLTLGFLGIFLIGFVFVFPSLNQGKVALVKQKEEITIHEKTSNYSQYNYNKLFNVSVNIPASYLNLTGLNLPFSLNNYNVEFRLNILSGNDSIFNQANDSAHRNIPRTKLGEIVLGTIDSLRIKNVIEGVTETAPRLTHQYFSGYIARTFSNSTRYIRQKIYDSNHPIEQPNIQTPPQLSEGKKIEIIEVQKEVKRIEYNKGDDYNIFKQPEVINNIASTNKKSDSVVVDNYEWNVDIFGKIWLTGEPVNHHQWKVNSILKSQDKIKAKNETAWYLSPPVHNDQFVAKPKY